MLQSQQITIKNQSIKDQIRQRRKGILDDQYDNDKPFRSYRKAKEQQLGQDLNNAMNKSKELSLFNHQAENIQLIRQYPSYSATLDNRQNKQQSLKFKYQLSDSDKFNNYGSQPIVQDSIRQNISAQSFVNKLQDKALTNKLLNPSSKRFQLGSKSNCRSQVKSVFFDSKVQQFQPFESKYLQRPQYSGILIDSQIQIFKEKVNKVNCQIEEGLSHLEMLIQAAKKKKIAKSILINQQNISQRQKDFYKNMMSYRDQRQKIMSQIVQTNQALQNQSTIKSKIKQYNPGQIKQEQHQIQINNHRQQSQQKVKKITSQIHQKDVVNQKQIKEEMVIEKAQKPTVVQLNIEGKQFEQITLENQKKLLGKILQQQSHLLNTIQKAKANKLQESQQCHMIKPDQNIDQDNKKKMFPPQYTSFINRLVSQIQLDIQFTTMISDLSKNNHLSQIKSLIFTELQKYQNDIQLIESFFVIESSQIDPLQPKKPYFTMKYKQQQGKEQALRIYKKYRQIQKYFATKLQNKYDIQIIKILLQQLSQFNFTKNDLQDKSNVTIGHLLSYLNMKTNKSLRNRFFVKMMKRLNLRSNQNLSIESLKIFIAQ